MYVCHRNARINFEMGCTVFNERFLKEPRKAFEYVYIELPKTTTIVKVLVRVSRAYELFLL